ncbi:glutamate synthase large subunit [Dokdonella ginsengisoli]|uniref:Glutamate synthase large subunit n=1 Tax=Dokdonella ginsengisoli TaxID=363846 RepID=A0ABV9QQ07_9GAMM
MAATRHAGLYDPAYEHDSCGFGLIAQIDARAGTGLVDKAFGALERMAHRGAVGADGLSGDGCGILLHRPTAWLRALAAEAGISPGPHFAAGLVFLSPDPALREQSVAELEARLRDEGLGIAGWREVPLDLSVCGEQAAASLPRIAQLFVDAPEAAGFDEAAFDRKLYRARRLATNALPDEEHFYIVSLSASMIGYKAMVLPGALRRFYPDLARPDLAACAAVFHNRFSTNTTPQWRLAQPFRYLAHNGEINTIRANRSWMAARAKKLVSPQFDFSTLGALVTMSGSDSQSLDNALELLLIGGIALPTAMRILVPPAWSAREDVDADLAAFYEYYGLHTEPWDGPAGLVMCDGRYAACTLDRNGLRPARWALSADRHLVVASEAGIWDYADADLVEKGRLGPGEMIAADLAEHRLLKNADVDALNRSLAPFKQWLREGVTYLESHLIDPSLAAEPFPPELLARFQKLFGLSREERDTILTALAEDGVEATGSMGDDTPIAALSGEARPLYDYFRQAFAQVTNPPIDPLRETAVMSLVTQIGPEGNIFELSAANATQVLLTSPILSQRKLRQLLALPQFANAQCFVDLYYRRSEGLEAALKRICIEATTAVRAGARLVFLSDRYPPQPAGPQPPDKLPIHALLATGAIHQALVAAQLRCDCNLLVETGTARDAHHFACLIGFGASAVYPYLAYQTLFDLGRNGRIRDHDGEPRELGRTYRKGIRKGLLKIISKMGISTIAGYRGAQLFEIVGLDRAVVDLCFAGAPARIGGTLFADLEDEQRERLLAAFDDGARLSPGGLLKYVHGGEFHAYNPDVVGTLQAAVRSGDTADYRRYADLVDGRAPAALRDLLELRDDLAPVPLEEVEPVEAILKRFDSAGMSLGALSPEAHETLAQAMNRLGARSNSGEGGEDPARYGTDKMSKIKQVASARFGVTPEYLVNAEVLQIKIAQGAKPGEGGQLPGHKVNELIARLRYARPGIGLISPPPHHDIYSIEDLAQLIFDLKEVNPDALVSVKLVAHAGVGTIAAGVVKAYADLITISGHDGGTGASPLTSIRYAGVPWELGLAEAHETLRRNGLRERVRLQTDGGLKTGLDVIKAAILGAESFGFGTAPMIAMGCKYLRICHLNTCATGVATQLDVLRKNHFVGTAELVMRYFRFVAEDVRGHLARLGLRRLEELVGRVDLVRRRGDLAGKHERVDVAPLLNAAGFVDGQSQVCSGARNVPRDPGSLAARIAEDTRFAVEHRRGGEFRYAVSNTDRSLGARLSGEVARRHGDRGMDAHPITLRLSGSAGQSLGAWNAGGVHIVLEGEANDGVGKGMAGGRIVVHPPHDAGFVARDAVIVGNTCLYGATGGELYAAGTAGERFAVRNSGALAVVEGTGDHTCEYMTGGIVVVLGRTGINFGAGMTGGFAYVLDTERDFVDRYNHELIDIQRISPEGMENHLQHLSGLVAEHVRATGSAWGAQIQSHFRDLLPKFWLVKPKAASVDSLIDELRRAA